MTLKWLLEATVVIDGTSLQDLTQRRLGERESDGSAERDRCQLCCVTCYMPLAMSECVFLIGGLEKGGTAASWRT